MKSYLEEIVFNRIKFSGIPLPEREYRFDPSRRWRFDFAYPDKKIAIECEGGIWANGRHNRGSGYVKDCEKYNTAAVLGWRIIRITTENVNDLERMLKIILDI